MIKHTAAACKGASKITEPLVAIYIRYTGSMKDLHGPSWNVLSKSCNVLLRNYFYLQVVF